MISNIHEARSDPLPAFVDRGLSMPVLSPHLLCASAIRFCVKPHGDADVAKAPKISTSTSMAVPFWGRATANRKHHPRPQDHPHA
jgi:hypothetical protein